MEECDSEGDRWKECGIFERDGAPQSSSEEEIRSSLSGAGRGSPRVPRHEPRKKRQRCQLVSREELSVGEAHAAEPPAHQDGADDPGAADVAREEAGEEEGEEQGRDRDAEESERSGEVA